MCVVDLLGMSSTTTKEAFVCLVSLKSFSNQILIHLPPLIEKYAIVGNPRKHTNACSVFVHFFRPTLYYTPTLSLTFILRQFVFFIFCQYCAITGQQYDSRLSLSLSLSLDLNSDCF